MTSRGWLIVAAIFFISFNGGLLEHSAWSAEGALRSTTPHNELNLYVFRSPGLSWESPVDLSRSVVQSYAQIPKHPIGHVAAEYRCDATADHGEIHEYIAMNMQDPLQPIDDLFVRGLGLGLLFDDLGGRVEGEKEIEAYKAEYDRWLHAEREKLPELAD